jgi:hypothetical protein
MGANSNGSEPSLLCYPCGSIALEESFYDIPLRGQEMSRWRKSRCCQLEREML